MPDKKFGLFEVYGIELEYMLVSKETLDIMPAVDRLLMQVCGEAANDYIDGEIGWANELVLHVMEVRNDNPSPSLDGLDQEFHRSIKKINALAANLGAQLMPTAMHPWMNPARDTVIWPHAYTEVYHQFDRIFNCRRHGWANLQSCQLNLPFANDSEFEKLHAAIRVLLPLMPALATSSPILEMKTTDFINNRLEVYKSNADKTPLVAGKCIPEPVYTKKEYEEVLLPSIFEQIKPYDPEGTLQHEWLNARGAIARFDRSAIEIRILDTQEHPGVDIAICKTLAAVLKLLTAGAFGPVHEIKNWDMLTLQGILNQNIRTAEETVIDNQDYLRLWGIREKKCTSREIWQYLLRDKIAADFKESSPYKERMETILREGVLARRILKAAGGDLSKARVGGIYRELSRCLAEEKMFHA